MDALLAQDKWRGSIKRARGKKKSVANFISVHPSLIHRRSMRERSKEKKKREREQKKRKKKKRERRTKKRGRGKIGWRCSKSLERKFAAKEEKLSIEKLEGGPARGAEQKA